MASHVVTWRHTTLTPGEWLPRVKDNRASLYSATCRQSVSAYMTSHVVTWRHTTLTPGKWLPRVKDDVVSMTTWPQQKATRAQQDGNWQQGMQGNNMVRWSSLTCKHNRTTALRTRICQQGGHESRRHLNLTPGTLHENCSTCLEVLGSAVMAKHND